MLQLTWRSTIAINGNNFPIEIRNALLTRKDEEEIRNAATHLYSERVFCSFVFTKKLKLIASSFYSVVLSILACIKCEHIKEVKMSTDSFTLLSFVCLLSSFGSCQQDDSSVHENLTILKRVVSWMLFCILKFQFAILSKFTFVKNGVYSGDTR